MNEKMLQYLLASNSRYYSGALKVQSFKSVKSFNYFQRPCPDGK